MGKKIIITEKPSVARAFAHALGVFDKETGYMENNEWIITWCVGHLVTMSYPEKYCEDLKKWEFETLPFLPDEYKYEVINESRDQFNVVRKLYNRNDISAIYYAGDAAREGLYIQMLVRDLAGHKAGIDEKVVWIDSQTDSEIKRGIREAKSLSEYADLSDAGYLRAIEDFAVGINLTRAYSLRFGKPLNLRKPIAVGRVMTCVLSMIVEREREIRNFKPESFYKINAKSNNDLTFGWKANKESPIYPKIAPFLYDETGFKSEDTAKSFAAGLGPKLIIDSVETKQEKKYAPLLFNLAELQNECSKKFKISPDETLEIAEKLYMAGLITYPRTDARVLSSAIADEIDINLKGISSIDNNNDFIKTIKNPTEIKKTRYTDDSKISDHYALIPTGQNLSALRGLSDIERGVYDLIERRFISIFMPPAIYDKTVVSGHDNKRNEQFFLNASVLKDPGFMAVSGTDAEEAKPINLKSGDELDVNYEIAKGETKPKPRYTSGSIILAMENAGKLIEDEALREQIKGQGIGTSATRAAILTKLCDNSNIGINKKTQVITPTALGEVIYDIVANTVPELTVPEMTAKWETELDDVANGRMKRDKYQNMINESVIKYVDIVKNAVVEDAIKESAKQLPDEFKKSENGTKSAPVKTAEIETYLNVSFEDKDKVKLLGARWDSNKRMWYVPKGQSLEPFAEFVFDKKVTSIKKIFLNVPFDDKDKAKGLGARWDGVEKKWYISSAMDQTPFATWI